MATSTSNPDPEPKLKVIIKPKLLKPVKSLDPEIVLTDYQIPHVAKLSRILDQYPVAMDFSMLGAGKTYTASHIALHHTLKFKHVIVICPLSLRSKWAYMQDHYRVPIHAIETYNSIRSVKCTQPKHGLLKRVDYKQTVQKSDGDGQMVIDKIDFHPTELLEKLVNEGVLLVIDEFHNIKNTTAQFFSCQAMIKAIANMGFVTSNPSRVLLISGSPFDKEEQIINMFRLIGIMTDHRLTQHNPFTYRYEWKGFLDIYECAVNFYRGPGVLPENIVVPYKDYGTAGQLRKLSYQMFQQIIKPVIASSMQLTLPQSIDKFNGFYDIMDEMDRTLLVEGINKLKSSTNFNGQDVTFGRNATDTLAAITGALRIIETAKISSMVRVIKKHLMTHATSKAVICVNFTDSVTDLCEGLKEFNPLVLTGSTKDADRGTIIAKFNEHDLTRRLLIGNLKVCSTGIDLDDKFGDRPRFCIVSPNYSSIDLYQVCHRFLRMDSKSKATVHMFYGKPACELAILNALACKSRTMKETTEEQVKSGVLFPCDFTHYIEPGGAPVCREIHNFITGAAMACLGPAPAHQVASAPAPARGSAAAEAGARAIARAAASGF